MAFSWMWEDFLKGRAETACNTEQTLSAKNMLQIFLNMPDSYLSPDSLQFTPRIQGPCFYRVNGLRSALKPMTQIAA